MNFTIEMTLQDEPLEVRISIECKSRLTDSILARATAFTVADDHTPTLRAPPFFGEV